MQGFVMRVNPLLNPLARSCLKQPVNGGGRVQDDHPRSPVIVPAVIIPAIFLHVLLAPGGQYRVGQQPARADADACVGRSKLAAPRLLEFLLISNPTMTCPPWRPGLSECGGGRPAHSAAESSSTCHKHTFMWNTCQDLGSPLSLESLRPLLCAVVDGENHYAVTINGVGCDEGRIDNDQLASTRNPA